MMKGDQTWDEYMAENLRDPEYAHEHAIGRPFSNLTLNVWSLRELAGLTQQQLAQRAGIRQPRIAEIERDEVNPTLMTISRIAVALGVTASDLLAEPDRERLAQARAMPIRKSASARRPPSASRKKKAKTRARA